MTQPREDTRVNDAEIVREALAFVPKREGRFTDHESALQGEALDALTRLESQASRVARMEEAAVRIEDDLGSNAAPPSWMDDDAQAAWRVGWHDAYSLAHIIISKSALLTPEREDD